MMLLFSVHLTNLIGESNERVIVAANNDAEAFNEAQRLASSSHKIVVGVKGIGIAVNMAEAQRLLDESIQS